MQRPNPPSFRRAFTLLECLIASMILATSAAAALTALAAAYQHERAAGEARQATRLAEQLLEEVVGLPFNPLLAPPASPATNLATAADLMQASGYADTVVPPDAAGAFGRRVLIERRITASGAANVLGPLAVVAVTVTTPAGEELRLVRLVTQAQR